MLVRNLRALFRSDLLADRGPRNNKNNLNAFAINFWMLCVAKCLERLSALEPIALIEGESICETSGLDLALLTTKRNNTIYCSIADCKESISHLGAHLTIVVGFEVDVDRERFVKRGGDVFGPSLGPEA